MAKRKNPEYGYALYDGESLSVIDSRIQAFWHKSIAMGKCPEGHRVRKVKIVPVTRATDQEA